MAVFGRTNTVYLHFYAQESDWSKYAEVMAQLASGFRRTQHQEVSIGVLAALPSGIDWQRAAGKGIVGAVVAAIAAMLGAMGRKKSKTGVGESSGV